MINTKFNLALALMMCNLLPTVTQAVCRDDITPSTPDSRFTINNDGTVTDLQTDLMWMQCSLGQVWEGGECVGDISTFSWSGALSEAQSYSFIGYDDWYLPNIKQLASIVEQACDSPAVNETIFPNTSSNTYWSSSPYAYSDGSAWYINFRNSGDGSYDKSNDEHVRLVRAGQ